ncbi:MAG: chromosome segregation protein SMC [Methanomassiliicoccales archaeon]
MYLRQIELENFKSFGKRLTIPLMEGYTAVTGPNGSGKSNISDAILFVLGPKSSRALRAGKLTDLIFNGGKSRDPASFTKVSLVFDNRDRMIPLEADTVKLTRLIKLTQGGEGYNSYFYVNGRKSTLAEFDTLLSNSRISADGYNLVQQGDVTNIVEMSDLERRRILDDISGISRFDNDIAKAEGERDQAEQNIERISIILTELQRQIEQLEEEKRAAERYLEVRDLLTRSRAEMAHKRKESTLSEIQSIKEQIQEYDREVEALRESKGRLESEIEGIDSRTSEIEERIQAKGGEEYQDLKRRIDQAKIELARTQDNRDRYLSDAEEIKENLEERKNEDIASEIQGMESRLEKKGSALEEKKQELEGKREELEQLNQRMRACDDEVQSLEEEVDGLDRELKEREGELHRLNLNRERLEDRRERLQVDVAELEEEYKNIEFEISDIDWNIKQIKGEAKDYSERLRELREQFHERKRQEDKLSRQSEELEQAIRRMTREYNHLKAEAEAAENVAKGYNRAVSSILEARDKGRIKGIHGTIAELAKVEDRYETALNVAAGSRMQSIVVEDDEVGAEAIEFLKGNKLGRATFLPLNKMRVSRPRGKARMVVHRTMGYAIDLIDFDERYRAVFSYVLGDTMVVEDLKKARELMGGVRLVSLDGEVIEASGAMAGGNLGGGRLKFGGSSRGKLEELGRELQAMTAESENVNQELQQVRQEMMELESQIRELGGSGDLKGDRVKNLESRKGELRDKLGGIKDELAKKGEEMDRLGEEISTLEGTERELNEEMERLRSARERRSSRIMELAPKELSSGLKELQEEVHRLTGQVSEMKGEKESLETQLRLLRERRDDFERMEREAQQKIGNLHRQAEEAEGREEELKKDLAGLRKIEDSMDQEIKRLKETKDQLFQKRTRLDAERDKIQGKIETSSDFTIGLRTKLSIAEERLKEVEEEISQYEVEVSFPLPTLEKLKQTIRECETAMSDMGAVNLRAIDDHQEKVNRYEELRGEMERLESQKGDLLELMEELNEKKKVRFLEVFEAVSENFKSVYSELSDGGEASLSLADPEEPFQGGLIIRARPKSGKSTRLQALSGGEKSLTALSFIFAIQEYQPSPFYLLDEVDMFLDAVNADMVARRVQKASRMAQFVQITLRKVTMNKADHLIGVTMRDSGISKVIMRPHMEDQKMFKEAPEEAEGAA